MAPFAFSDGTCEFCHKGVFTSCIHGDFWGGKDNDGGQAEACRAPLADGTLVKLPEAVENDEGLLKAILPLTDVMGTGHHAAVSAGVRAGATVAVESIGRIEARWIGQSDFFDDSGSRFQFPDDAEFFAQAIVFDRSEREQVLGRVKAGSERFGRQRAGGNFRHDPVARSDADHLALLRVRRDRGCHAPRFQLRDRFDIAEVP